MIGFFVHIVKTVDDGIEIEYQLEVVDNLGGGNYLLQFYSMLDGEATHCSIFNVEDMKGFRFYQNRDAWIRAFDRSVDVDSPCIDHQSVGKVF